MSLPVLWLGRKLQTCEDRRCGSGWPRYGRRALSRQKGPGGQRWTCSLVGERGLVPRWRDRPTWPPERKTAPEYPEPGAEAENGGNICWGTIPGPTKGGTPAEDNEASVDAPGTVIGAVVVIADEGLTDKVTASGTLELEAVARCPNEDVAEAGSTIAATICSMEAEDWLLRVKRDIESALSKSKNFSSQGVVSTDPEIQVWDPLSSHDLPQCDWFLIRKARQKPREMTYTLHLLF